MVSRRRKIGHPKREMSANHTPKGPNARPGARIQRLRAFAAARRHSQRGLQYVQKLSRSLGLQIQFLFRPLLHPPTIVFLAILAARELYPAVLFRSQGLNTSTSAHDRGVGYARVDRGDDSQRQHSREMRGARNWNRVKIQGVLAAIAVWAEMSTTTLCQGLGPLV
jgi:hypothetical protein